MSIGAPGPACIHSAIGSLDLFDPDPVVRLQAARAAGRLARRSMMRRVSNWPPFSPAAANAWLLFVTAKPPTWRDPMMTWPQQEPTLGEPHPGLFYPDPLGFWIEVRRWAALLVRRAVPTMSASDAFSLLAVIHSDDDAARLRWATERCQPVVTLFLDEASRELALATPGQTVSIPDPHRAGTTYDGWWTAQEGRVVGKAPQHPASHRFYRAGDMDAYLSQIPLDRSPVHPPD